MTLAQVGGEDLSRSFLSLVETGRSRISVRALTIVAERLGLPMSYFLEGASAGGEAERELTLDRVEAALRERRADEALRLIPDDVPERLRWRALWLRGLAMVDLGQAREAIPVLEEAAAASESSASPRDHAQVLYVLAQALYARSAYSEARGHLEKAVVIAQELDDTSILGLLTVALGHIAYSLGDFEQAIAAYDRARDLFAGMRDPVRLASIYAGLSRVYERSGDTEAALRYSRLSLGIHEQRHNEREAARELAAIAERSLKLGQIDRALTDAREALTLAQQAKSPDIEALARVALARASVAARDFTAADTEVTVAEQQAQSLGQLTQGEILLVRAALAEERGDQDAMDDYYRSAIDLFKDIGHRARLAEAALIYSRKLQERGDTENALAFALMAAEARQVESR